MNLIIDIGNSRIKAAVVDNGQVVENYVFEELLEADLQRLVETHPAVDKAIVASTAHPIDEIAEKLQAMCDDEKIVKELKNGAREFILSKYNWNDVADSTYNLYKKVMKK